MQAGQGVSKVVAGQDIFVPGFHSQIKLNTTLLFLLAVPLSWGQSAPASTVPNSKCAECNEVEVKLQK